MKPPLNTDGDGGVFGRRADPTGDDQLRRARAAAAASEG